MINITDHTDIISAERDGFPVWVRLENRDCEGYRDEYITENLAEFLDWMKAGDQDVLDRFFQEHDRAYRDFLN